MRGVRPLVVVAFLAIVVAGSTFGAGAQSVADGDRQQSSPAVSVTNVTVSPENPVAGNTFEVEATIRNYEGASTAVEISEAYVQTDDGRGYVADNLGTLPPGSATTVSLPVTVDDPGQQTLSLRVNGLETDSSTAVRVRQPIPVRVVDDDKPRLSIVVTDPVVGQSSTANVTVANGNAKGIQNLELRLDGQNFQIDNPTRVQASLAGESDETYEFSVTPAEAGTGQLTGRLTYTDESGSERTVTQRRELSVADRGPRAALSGLQVNPRGGTLTVRGSVTNGGSTAIEGVRLAVGANENVGPAMSQSTYFVGNISSNDFTSFEVNAALQSQTNQTVTIPIEVSYVVNGVQKQRVVDVDYRPRPQPAEVQRPRSGGGGLPITLIGGVVVLGGVGLYGWRRYRG